MSESTAIATVDNYHTDHTALTRTALSVFKANPADYDLVYNQGLPPRKKPTQRMDKGAAVHSIVLDRKPIEDCIAIYDEGCLKSDGSINHKPASMFREINPGKVCMKEEAAVEIISVCRAVQASPIGELLQDDANDFEKTVTATIEDVESKMRGDIVRRLAARVLCFDLKIVEDNDDGLFHQNARRLCYWLQDAHYTAVLEAAYGLPVEFAFFQVELAFPHRIRLYTYDIPSRESARDKHRDLLRRFSGCRAANEWPDKFNSTLVIEPWEMDANEEGVYTDGD